MKKYYDIVIAAASPHDRQLLKTVLASMNVFRVIGESSKSQMILQLIKEREIDLAFIDLELADTDGLDLIRTIPEETSASVIVVSRLLRYCSNMLIDELEKLNIFTAIAMPRDEREGEHIVKTIVKYIERGEKPTTGKLASLGSRSFRVDKFGKMVLDGSVVVIGGSTGSLQPLYKLMGGIDIDHKTVVIIATHVIKTEKTIDKMRRVVKADVEVVDAGTKLELGRIYILRSGSNYGLSMRNNNLFFNKFRERLGLGYRPSINLVMENFSTIFRERCIGVILSGHGSDGVLGSRIIVLRGGKVLLQNPENARTPSMPRLTYEALSKFGIHLQIIDV